MMMYVPDQDDTLVLVRHDLWFCGWTTCKQNKQNIEDVVPWEVRCALQPWFVCWRETYKIRAKGIQWPKEALKCELEALETDKQALKLELEAWKRIRRP